MNTVSTVTLAFRFLVLRRMDDKDWLELCELSRRWLYAMIAFLDRKISALKKRLAQAAVKAGG